MAQGVIPALREHLAGVRLTHEEDLRAGGGAVYLPGALDRKYPNAAREWGWQYVFPARDLSRDPRSGAVRRHHVDEATINKAIKAAVARAGIAKQASSHTFRDARPAAGGGHSYDSGVAGAQRCLHDDDLHPCAAPRRRRDEKPIGLPVSSPHSPPFQSFAEPWRLPANRLPATVQPRRISDVDRDPPREE